MHKQHTTITLVLIFSTLFGGMLPSITFDASRTTPFSVGETTEPRNEKTKNRCHHSRPPNVAIIRSIIHTPKSSYLTA